MIDIDKLIAEAEVRGKKFFEQEEVKGYLLPYRKGGLRYIDPLLLWFLRRIKETGRIPEMAFIFQDWWLQEIDKKLPTVDESLVYIDKVCNSVLSAQVMDQTLRHVFHSYWSRTLIEEGRCMMFNAAWGIRSRKELGGKYTSSLRKCDLDTRGKQKARNAFKYLVR
jgi:hypothetical protein